MIEHQIFPTCMFAGKSIGAKRKNFQSDLQRRKKVLLTHRDTCLSFVVSY